MWPDHPAAEVPGMQCESLQGGIVGSSLQLTNAIDATLNF